MLSLSISFRMITGSEVYMHIKSFSEGVEEAGHEFRSAVASNVVGNSVLGEQVGDE